MGNPRRLYVADNSKPEIRQRQPQTNTRKCGTQPAHKSMPAVVKMPCLLLCSTASRMREILDCILEQPSTGSLLTSHVVVTSVNSGSARIA